MLKAEVRPVAPETARTGFARYAWGVLAYNVAVILWGAYVRASGSGAGCGNHWPLCNGVVVPLAPASATVIEFTHRLMSGTDVLAVGVLLVWAFRAFPRRHPVRLGTVLSAVFLVIPVLNQWYWGDLCIFRLFAIPIVLMVLLFSRWLTRFARARRLISYALLVEGLTLVLGIASLFLFSKGPNG